MDRELFFKIIIDDNDFILNSIKNENFNEHSLNCVISISIECKSLNVLKMLFENNYIQDLEIFFKRLLHRGERIPNNKRKYEKEIYSLVNYIYQKIGNSNLKNKIFQIIVNHRYSLTASKLVEKNDISEDFFILFVRNYMFEAVKSYVLKNKKRIHNYLEIIKIERQNLSFFSEVVSSKNLEERLKSDELNDEIVSCSKSIKILLEIINKDSCLMALCGFHNNLKKRLDSNIVNYIGKFL